MLLKALNDSALSHQLFVKVIFDKWHTVQSVYLSVSTALHASIMFASLIEDLESRSVAGRART